MRCFSLIKRKSIVAMIALLSVICSFGIIKHFISVDSRGESTSSVTDNSSTLEMEIIGYLYGIQKFEELNVDQIEEMLDGRNPFFLYTGRVTCQWCRKVVPLLAVVAEEENIKIYYLDSENTDSDVALKEFRDNYEILTVPSIIYFDSTGKANHIESNVSDTSFRESDFLAEIVSYNKEMK